MMKKSYMELGFFAKGMILLLPSGGECVITNIRDGNGMKYEKCSIDTMDANGLFLELDHDQYLCTDNSWFNFPKDILCKNADVFIEKSFN